MVPLFSNWKSEWLHSYCHRTFDMRKKSRRAKEKDRKNQRNWINSMKYNAFIFGAVYFECNRELACHMKSIRFDSIRLKVSYVHMLAHNSLAIGCSMLINSVLEIVAFLFGVFFSFKQNVKIVISFPTINSVYSLHMLMFLCVLLPLHVWSVHIFFSKSPVNWNTHTHTMTAFSLTLFFSLFSENKMKTILCATVSL